MRAWTAGLLVVWALGSCGGAEETPTCIVFYDGCVNACEPTCVDQATLDSGAGCGVVCNNPQEPEAPCQYFGGECVFR